MANVTFFLCEQMLATSVTLPMEQFRAAESLNKAGRSKNHQELNFILASIDGKSVKTQSGLTLTPDCALEEVEDSEITYLPALWRKPHAVIDRNRRIQPWLVKRSQDNRTIAGVGTGCCFMAEAGLLDFRPATTHWYFFDEFARMYPRVTLKRDYFITRSDNLFCAASVNALADLTVFFIQQIFDRSIARHVERHFFHEVRQAYPFAHHIKGEVQAHPDEEIAQVQSWIRHNPSEDIKVSELAKTLQMSLRTFNRRFKNAANVTPMQYIQGVRMRGAGELLQTSNLTISEIAYELGYQDLSHFTELFKKHFGTTPSHYRTTVRAKLFSDE